MADKASKKAVMMTSFVLISMLHDEQAGKQKNLLSSSCCCHVHFLIINSLQSITSSVCVGAHSDIFWT